MDNELQSKIAGALDKMINGAPEVWNYLVQEMYYHTLVATLIPLALAIIFGMIARSTFHKACFEDGNRYTVISIASIVVASFATLIAAVNAIDLPSPSIELIRLLTR